MGNVLTGTAQVPEAGTEVLDKVGKTGLYKALLSPKPRLKACHGCFTPWDTLSMYFDDEITLSELCAAPTYAPPRIRALLAELKSEYVRERDAGPLPPEGQNHDTPRDPA